MEWIHSVLCEGKVYGMVALIAGVVWVVGYSVRVDERWNQTQWMAPAEADPGMILTQLDDHYFD